MSFQVPREMRDMEKELGFPPALDATFLVDLRI